MLTSYNYQLQIVDVRKSIGLGLTIFVRPFSINFLRSDVDPLISEVLLNLRPDASLARPLNLNQKECNDLLRALDVGSNAFDLKGLMFPDMLPEVMSPRESLDEFFRTAKKIWVRGLEHKSDGTFELLVSFRSLNAEVRLPTWQKRLAKFGKWLGIYSTAKVTVDKFQMSRLMYNAGGGSPGDLVGTYFLLSQFKVFRNPIKALDSVLI